MPSPNIINTSVEEVEGKGEQREALSVGLSEEKINKIIGKRVDAGKSFYDSKLNLTEVRENNEKRWMNLNCEVSEGVGVYDYQIPYKDNRIFVSVETLTSHLVPRIPIPEVIEAHDKEASRELASSYEKVLLRTAEDLFFRGHLRMATRHVLMGYRVGIIKTRWDFTKGRRKANGDHVGAPDMHFVRPHKVIIDADVTDPNDIPLIAETLSSTVEELIIDFPDKKVNILTVFAANEGLEKLNLGTRVSYREIWFTYYEDGQRKEGVAWKYKNLMLGFGVNPYFNYGEDEEKSNFLERPFKPYTFITYLRIGRWVYDDTSLTEQAASQQDNLEKRGLQIIDNADQANAVKVWNTQMVKAGDAEKYVGDPNDNILSDGDARMAFARYPAPSLPRYVVEDKYDSRREIDNIFGTHSPLRGEKTESPTLGQEVMSQRADLGRTTSLSEAVEEAATKIYKQITQLYKVFATEENIVKYLGEEGKTTFIKFSKDKIEDGIEIRVQAGSLRPEDKISDRNEAVELAKIGGRIDPLTFAEKWHLAKPLEFAKRVFTFTFMPDTYAKETLKMGGGEGDQEAMSAIQQIMSGERLPPKEDASKEYMAYFSQFLQSPSFKQLDPEVQTLVIEHTRGTMEATKVGLKEGVGVEEEKPGVLSQIAKRLRGET